MHTYRVKHWNNWNEGGCALSIALSSGWKGFEEEELRGGGGKGGFWAPIPTGVTDCFSFSPCLKIDVIFVILSTLLPSRASPHPVFNPFSPHSRFSCFCYSLCSLRCSTSVSSDTGSTFVAISIVIILHESSSRFLFAAHAFPCLCVCVPLTPVSQFPFSSIESTMWAYLWAVLYTEQCGHTQTEISLGL